MADAAQVTPILSPQERQQEQQHTPVHDHVHLQQQHAATTLDTFNHQTYSDQEQQQHQQSTGHQDVTFHSHQQAHDRQLVESITRAFLLQEMTSDPTGVRQGSQSMLLQQHAPSAVLPAEADDELNIYDYIYAKQEEDDDEPEDHVVSASSLSPSPAIVATSSTIQDLSHLSPALRASSLPSSPSASITTATSTSPSCVSQYDHATANTMSKETSSLDASSIKTKQDDINSNVLFGPVNYMDTSMEIYEPSQVASLPNQDIYRLLLDELQATNQREKYFAATTAPHSAMDSVTFLFNGQQTQTQTPTNPNMQMMGETAASPSVFSTKPEPLLAVKCEFEKEMGTSDPGPAALSFSSKRAPYSSSSMEMDDVFMETAEPEDSPMSPGHSPSSPSSSGSVTPELTSPTLPPTKTASLPSSMPSSPRLELTKTALKITLPKLSKSTHSASSKSSRSASVSPITQLNFMSAIEQHNARHKAAAGAKRNGEPSLSTESGTQTGRAKKRKLSRQTTSISPGLSPILTALPSPPASVRTTPPMHSSSMMDISSALEKIDLPPPSIPVKGASAVEPSSPMSPTAPRKVNRAESTTDDDDVIMESAAGSTHTPASKKKNANAKNKRPWTTEEEKLLLKMVDNQTPIKDIAETLDRSVHSVRSRRQVLTDPGFVKGNGHAQPRRSKPDPSSKLPTYSQMAFLSLARLPDLQGTLNDVASMVEKLFSRYLNRIPRTGHKNLQIWRAQISDALAHEKGHPRPRFESFGIKRGRQWVYRLTVFGKGVMDAMGSVDEICEDLLRNSETMPGGVDGEGTAAGGAGAGLGQGNGYGYSYCPDAFTTKSSLKDKDSSSDIDLDAVKKEVVEDTSPEALAASAAIANAMAAMAAGMAAMTAAEDEKNAAALSMSILKTGLSGPGTSKANKSSVQEAQVASGSRGRRNRA
ncbi:hypothetical protein EC991_001961 [Linnemannia zychae]|nr:hypothetical protein EC991_001961 [Linnemannia zychae]